MPEVWKFYAKHVWMAFPVPCSCIHEYASINGFHPDGGLGDVWNKGASMPREFHYAGCTLQGRS